MQTADSLFVAEDYFALPNDLLVEPQPILERARLYADTRRAAEQAHPGRRLKNIRRERAAVHVKFHAQVSRVRNPRNLIAGIEHYGLWDESNEYGPLRHRRFPNWCLP